MNKWLPQKIHFFKVISVVIDIDIFDENYDYFWRNVVKIDVFLKELLLIYQQIFEDLYILMILIHHLHTSFEIGSILGKNIILANLDNIEHHFEDIKPVIRAC